MNLYTKKAVNIISIFITILIFFISNKIDYQNLNFNINLKKVSEVQEELNQSELNQNTISQNILKEDNYTKENSEYENIEEYDWGIYIPAIKLSAPIEETVEKEVMDRAVGHFSNTSKIDGNIGLGAHNRGYKVNYFQNIKKLKRGDAIFYKYNEQVRQYLVSNIVIIKDTDWSYLEETNDNRITLITCVENEPKYRRCIQGEEKK